MTLFPTSGGRSNGSSEPVRLGRGAHYGELKEGPCLHCAEKPGVAPSKTDT